MGIVHPSRAADFETPPGDLGICGEPQETGETPMENALIKAHFYGRLADTVIRADPGLHVRTPDR